jgi:Zn-dependent protease
MDLLSHASQTLRMLPALLIGLTVHEFAHAWSSSMLGDDFARRQGRVSLNPLRHLTPLGTLAILFLPFGWGKPVPINLYNYKHPKRDYLLSSLAGPLANVVMMGLGLGLLQLTRHSYALGDRAAWWMVQAHLLVMMVVIINAVLAMVNLIPIPPLDGSKIWPCLIPGRRASFAGGGSSRWLMLMVFVLFARGTFDPMFAAVIGQLCRIMPDSDVVAAVRQSVDPSQDQRYDSGQADGNVHPHARSDHGREDVRPSSD